MVSNSESRNVAATRHQERPRGLDQIFSRLPYHNIWFMMANADGRMQQNGGKAVEMLKSSSTLARGLKTFQYTMFPRTVPSGEQPKLIPTSTWRKLLGLTTQDSHFDLARNPALIFGNVQIKTTENVSIYMQDIEICVRIACKRYDRKRGITFISTIHAIIAELPWVCQSPKFSKWTFQRHENRQWI